MKKPLLTKAQFKALGILCNTAYFNEMSARNFAEAMWGDTDTNMFKSVKNTGNGACSGKAAWLCAGSYLGRLRKKGWIYSTIDPTGYYITTEGKRIYDLQNLEK